MEYSNNVLYIDIEKLQHKYTRDNKTSNKIRLHIGKIGETQFEKTIESIKHIPEDEQEILRKYIKSIF